MTQTHQVVAGSDSNKVQTLPIFYRARVCNGDMKEVDEVTTIDLEFKILGEHPPLFMCAHFEYTGNWHPAQRPRIGRQFGAFLRDGFSRLIKYGCVEAPSLGSNLMASYGLVEVGGRRGFRTLVTDYLKIRLNPYMELQAMRFAHGLEVETGYKAYEFPHRVGICPCCFRKAPPEDARCPHCNFNQREYWATHCPHCHFRFEGSDLCCSICGEDLCDLGD